MTDDLDYDGRCEECGSFDGLHLVDCSRARPLDPENLPEGGWVTAWRRGEVENECPECSGECPECAPCPACFKPEDPK